MALLDIPTNRVIDSPRDRRMTCYDGKVLFFDCSCLKKQREMSMSPVVFRDYEYPGSIFIEAMNDAGSVIRSYRS